MKKATIVLLLFVVLYSCKEEKLYYKKIETRDYKVETYTYGNYTDKIFPDYLIVIDKKVGDTVYNCQNCYTDVSVILDTVVVYCYCKKDSILYRSRDLVIKQECKDFKGRRSRPW